MYLINIKKSEQSLFLSTFSILTLTICIHKILKVLKDTLVVTDPNIGIQLIPFLKIWAFIPISVIVIKCVYICKNKYSYKTTYGIALTFFMLCLNGYVFLIRPIETSFLGNTHFLNYLVPSYLQGFYLMLHYWPLSLFYVICDLWSIIMFSMLFWIYIDEIVSFEQGKRFFPLFSIDIGGIILGPIVILAAYFSGGSWERQLELLMAVVFILGLMLWCVFHKLSQKHKISCHKTPKSSKNTTSFNLIKRNGSSFVFHLALMVFIYEFTDSIFDLLWKGILVEYAPNPETFSKYLASIPSVSSVIATIIALFFSTTLLRKLSWFHIAVIAPILFGTLSLCFFLSYFFPFLAGWISTPLGISTLSVTISIGAIQTCLMSVAKVTVFDNSKDLAFQLCNNEEKKHARGFSNAFATRFGKSTSNFTYQISSIISTNIKAAALYLSCVLFVCIPIWLLGIVRTNKQFVLRTAKEIQQ